MFETVNRNLFISGGFSDTLKDIMALKALFENAGFDAKVKLNESDPTSKESIDECDYFICVIGVSESGIKTLSGETLPQMELSYAIRKRKKILAFIKHPLEDGDTRAQQEYRILLKKKFGTTAILFDDSSQLQNAVLEILRGGIDNYSSIVRPYKAFISYSSKDKGIVNKLVRRIKKAGFLTFYDEHDIGVGQSLNDSIQRALAEVGFVIVCLSDNALASSWVRDEIRWALENQSHLKIDDVPFILPVKVSDFTLPSELSFLADIKYADISNNVDAGVSTLLAAMMDDDL